MGEWVGGWVGGWDGPMLEEEGRGQERKEEKMAEEVGGWEGGRAARRRR